MDEGVVGLPFGLTLVLIATEQLPVSAVSKVVHANTAPGSALTLSPGSALTLSETLRPSLRRSAGGTTCDPCVQAAKAKMSSSGARRFNNNYGPPPRSHQEIPT